MKFNKGIWVKVIAIDMLYLCFSLNVSITGQMLGSLKEAYFLSLAQASFLLSIQSVGGLTLALMCILFIDALNITKILVFSGLILCSLLMVVGLIPPLGALFVIFAVLGFAGGSINTLANSVMVKTVPEKPERYINFMHMLFSLGAVTAPLLSQIIYSSSGFQGVFLLFGCFTLCWGIYAAFAFSNKMKQKLIKQKFSFKERYQSMLSVFKKPGMTMIFLIAIMTSSWQLSAIYYISSLFQQLNSDAMGGAIALSVLFLGMMISRLLYTKLADKYPKGYVLLMTNALGVIAWLAIFVVQGMIIKTVMVGVSAFFCGNNFPIIFSTACKTAPKNTATATGIVTLGYYIAILVFIPIIGSLGDTIGLSRSLVFCAVPLAAILPASLLLHRRLANTI